MTEAEQLYADGIISAGQLKHIEQYTSSRTFSIHWELRTILYTGILLLSSGVGIIVYKNINTIGHQTVLAAIALAITACFYYLHKRKQPYSNREVKQATPLFDYIALLGCLLFTTFVGYFQFQYHPFGNQLWLATLLPSILFLYCAYLFDHKGLLALGISGFAGALGLSLATAQLLYNDNFSDSTLLITALAFGIVLILVTIYSQQKGIKQHFSFTYHQFAATLLFVACLAFLFNYPFKLLSFSLLALLCFYFTRYAIAEHSFLFLLYAAVYTYIGITYIVFALVLDSYYDDGAFMLGLLYMIASCVGIIFFFIKYKKILRLS